MQRYRAIWGIAAIVWQCRAAWGREASMYHALGSFLPTMRAGINAFRIPGRFFDVHVFVLNSNSLTENIFHVCVFVPVTR